MSRRVRRRPAGTGHRVVLACLAAAGLGWLLGQSGTDPTPATLAVAATLVDGSVLRGSGVLAVAAWLAGGALAGGAVGWAVGSAVTAGAALLGLGFGLAVGGGLGTVLKLVVVDGEEAEPPATVTVGSGADRTDAPAPQPADLFENHPDPVLYYDDAGEGPVVRAVNGAFEDTFGVTAAAVEGAALADAAMVTARAQEVIDAAAAGERFEARLDCETATGVDSFRVRVAAVGDDAGARGYVLYTPAD